MRSQHGAESVRDPPVAGRERRAAGGGGGDHGGVVREHGDEYVCTQSTREARRAAKVQREAPRLKYLDEGGEEEDERLRGGGRGSLGM